MGNRYVSGVIQKFCLEFAWVPRNPKRWVSVSFAFGDTRITHGDDLFLVCYLSIVSVASKGVIVRPEESEP